jgi:hypothetical protein
MKKETVETLVKAGASGDEARAAIAFFELMRPALRRKRENGRFDLAGGDKNILGLYRTALRVIEENPHDSTGETAIMDLFRPCLKMNRAKDRISLSTGDARPRGLYWAVREFMGVRSKTPAPADLSRNLDNVEMGTPTVGPWDVLRVGGMVPHLVGGDHARIALLDDCHLDAEAKANEAMIKATWETARMLQRMTEKVRRIASIVVGHGCADDCRELRMLADEAREILSRFKMA